MAGLRDARQEMLAHQILERGVRSREVARGELEAGERVLEVGTGSGHVAAVLSRIAGEV